MTEENYNLVVENPDSTVVSAYKSQAKLSTAYQSEAQLEQAFIAQLQSQGYEYLPIKSEQDLLRNIRTQLERLNHCTFSEGEWNALQYQCICNAKMGIADKTRLIQEDYIQNLTMDDGTVKNIYLIDKENIHNNSLQVVNQYVPEGGVHDNRYDVTLLVNGLPLVHVELKRRGVSLKEAFNQINRYQRESFWAGFGLFEFVQVFVISNGTETKYYSNTTRDAHINEVKKSAKAGKQQTSNSYEFTSYWADRDNRTIRDLVDFTATFMAKHTLLNILTKYCIFTSERMLMVMRPYQIAATESILQRIETSSHYKTYGRVAGGGYVWHTTGSGKTLTSFKAARLASQLDYIDKVLFVVDRKDLDYQTMKEYDRFEKGAANSNRSTAVLAKQLEDSHARIIITTIQKLSTFIKKNPQHGVYTQHVVIIFDECHRSQFGEMHAAIVKRFKKYHLFGFTGTPIFPDNAGSTTKSPIVTTEQAFGDRLHLYTIVDAIRDENVLPFKVDYITTMKMEKEIADEKVWDIDRERAYAAPERISNVVKYILEHYDQKTHREGKSYSFTRVTNIGALASARYGTVQEKRSKVRLTGFNSILATASIPMAIAYYQELQKQMALMPADRRLKVGLIYSYSPNEDSEDENSDGTDGLDKSSRDFLEQAIGNYNEMFGTNYDTSAEKFQNYYKDVSLRMKNRELDLLVVVNMFLTGFDATTLNTLWVDKNLRMHGLLQAFSRTNRILNSIKRAGNIVCFRNLERETNESIALFGDKNAGGIILIRTFEDYYNGYKDESGEHHRGYVEMLSDLLHRYPIEKPIVGEKAEKGFIRLFGTLLKAENLLKTFDQWEAADRLSDGQRQDYLSIYNSLYDKYRKNEKNDATNVNDDIEFEMELVRQIEVNIDYILYMVEQMHSQHNTTRTIETKVRQLVESSPDLRDKKELIMNFIGQLRPDDDITSQWLRYANEMRWNELNKIIAEEGLKAEETQRFLSHCFDEGEFIETGTEIVSILPPMSIFGNDRAAKKTAAVEKLKAFFTKYYPITDRMPLHMEPAHYYKSDEVLQAADQEDTKHIIIKGPVNIHGDVKGPVTTDSLTKNIFNIHNNKISD